MNGRLTMTNEPERRAYVRMAQEARYYPEAPSDGFGNIVGEIDVHSESLRYANRADFQEHTFDIGCADFSSREALAFTVEAARAICGTNHDLAIDLLRMALSDLEKVVSR